MDDLINKLIFVAAALSFTSFIVVFVKHGFSKMAFALFALSFAFIVKALFIISV